MPALAVNIIIVHPWDVVFPLAKALGKTTPLGWTIMMFTLSAGNTCIVLAKKIYVCDKTWQFLNNSWNNAYYSLETTLIILYQRQPLCTWSYDSWICIYVNNQWSSPLWYHNTFLETILHLCKYRGILHANIPLHSK